MPYLVTTSKYPSDIAAQVAQRYVEAMQKHPPDESIGTMVVPVAGKSTTEGQIATSITEVKEGKLEEAIQYAQTVLEMFRDIVGFESQTEVQTTAEEGLATLGISIPG